MDVGADGRSLNMQRKCDKIIEVVKNKIFETGVKCFV